MTLVVLANVLRDAINARIDEKLRECPEAEKDREIFYRELLAYYYEHGTIPDFAISKKEAA